MGVEAGGSGPSRGSDRPGLDPHRFFAIWVPNTWPEVQAYGAGARLFVEEADEVPELIRTGGSLSGHLRPDELTAELVLGLRSFERWFRLGWSRAAGDEED